MSPTTCPNLAELEALFMGGLPNAQAQHLEQHIHECDHCAQRLADLMARQDSLSDLLRQPVTPDDYSSSVIVRQLLNKLKVQTGTHPPPNDNQTTIPLTCSQCHTTFAVAPPRQSMLCPTCGLAVSRPLDLEGMATIPPRAVSTPEQAETPTDPPRYNPDATYTVDGSPVHDTRLTDFLAPPQLDDELGRLGHYRVLKILGHGGMGVVYQAEDTKLKRLVAIKVMLPALAASPSNAKRFLREAEAMATVSHDHVVRVYQIDEHRGIPFLAMEFLQGEALDECLKREQQLPIADVLRIGYEIADGLGAAHSMDLIHRDIKPANIWLEGPRRRVKILDFGLARAATQHAGLTAQGAIVGTPAYMAPEQGRGGVVEARSDLFSLGVVLYRMATGQAAFPMGDMVATIMAVATTTPPAPRTRRKEIPPELSALIVKLMEKDPERRFASAALVAQELRRIERKCFPHATANDTAIVEHDPPTFATPQHHVWRRWGAIAGGMLAVLLIVASVFYIPTKNGTIRIEILDEETEVLLTANGVTFKDKENETTLRAGEHTLHIKRGNLEFETEQFSIKKGETLLLKVEYLKDKLIVRQSDGKLLGSKDVPAKTVQIPPLPKKDPHAPAQQRYALRFDGLDSYVSFPTLVDNTNQNITIEAWVLNENAELRFHLKTATGVWQLFRTEMGQYRLVFADAPGSQGIFMDKAPPVGQWSHIAAVSDKNNWAIFVDGKRVAIGGVKVSMPRSQMWLSSLGNTDLPPKRMRPMAGTVASLRISPIARYKADFQPEKRFTSDEHTLGLYHFDEGQGDTLADASGHKHDGKIVAAKWQKIDPQLTVAPVSPFEWNATPEQERFFDVIRPLELKDQRNAVLSKLNSLNSWGHGNHISLTFEEKEGQVVAIGADPTRREQGLSQLGYVWPLLAFPKIQSLDLRLAHIADFTPLARLPLTDLKLNLALDNLTAERALRSITTLKTINDTPAADYWAKRATQRRKIDEMTAAVKLLDLDKRRQWFEDILRELHPQSLGEIATFEAIDGDLNRMRLALGNITDLAPLRALPIEQLRIEAPSLCDLSSLALLPIKQLTLHRALYLRDLQPLANLSLQVLELSETSVSDLRPLMLLKLESLMVRGQDVETDRSPLVDLTPLTGLPLKALRINGTRVRDLRPLEGMKLTQFHARWTDVTDLSPLKGMPLEELHVGVLRVGNPEDVGERIVDWGLLEGWPLKNLVCDPPLGNARDEKLLRGLKLTTINGQASAEFWKSFDAEQQSLKAFVEATQQLPPDKAITAITDYLRKHHNNVVRLEYKLTDHKLTELTFDADFDQRFNMVPLQALPHLKRLIINTPSPARRADLAPLVNLPIEEITFPEGLWRANRDALKTLPLLKTINGQRKETIFTQSP